MSYHKFSYYDYRRNKAGELLVSFVASSISEADKKVESSFEIKALAPFLGCRIDFDYCHSEDCPKESYSANTCRCGFTKRYIEKNKVRTSSKTQPYTPLYVYEPLPAEQTKLVDLEPILKAMRKMASSINSSDDFTD